MKAGSKKRLFMWIPEVLLYITKTKKKAGYKKANLQAEGRRRRRSSLEKI